MSPKTKILIGILGVVIIGGGTLFFWKSQTIEVVTDRKEYTRGEALKMKIRNSLASSVCFSSCYPYCLEHKEAGWEPYFYQDCRDVDVARDCMALGKVKAFEIVLPQTKRGVHRIVVPVCKDCRAGENFKMTHTLYSSPFEIR